MEPLNNLCPMAARRYEDVPIDKVKVINSRNRDQEQFDMNVESIGGEGLSGRWSAWLQQSGIGIHFPAACDGRDADKWSATQSHDLRHRGGGRADVRASCNAGGGGLRGRQKAGRPERIGFEVTPPEPAFCPRDRHNRLPDRFRPAFSPSRTMGVRLGGARQTGLYPNRLRD